MIYTTTRMCESPSYSNRLCSRKFRSDNQYCNALISLTTCLPPMDLISYLTLNSYVIELLL